MDNGVDADSLLPQRLPARNSKPETVGSMIRPQKRMHSNPLRSLVEDSMYNGFILCERNSNSNKQRLSICSSVSNQRAFVTSMLFSRIGYVVYKPKRSFLQRIKNTARPPIKLQHRLYFIIHTLQEFLLISLIVIQTNTK